MRFKIIAVGTRMPGWVEEGYLDYAKRLPRDFSVEVVELPLGPRGKNASIEKAIAREGSQMLAAIPKGDKVIALDVKGKPWSTEKLADNLAAWSMECSNYSILIGGPDGLAPECLARADAKWSLSALTLPHPLVRIVLIEQLYRAWSILNRHPYHK
ncbi:23S rRNA (pseudouridine(1915)-N(3))-methyltransferase RlmH [Pseudomaricurvus alkylphenolicus]|jgi:23S rRNA (pseudouridine1915-N3)-methyltransferase|uniref:23S rRNA (pseudouridine(1915)-N(3))-methyltransferase RlmH n=1 Tax=Pseudomaricurvus alkylphenolicus TaxID=1306991 RepID=UPI0014237739|nr:23S rRNA (pseudouridine(1915)-N(3))-methyltransferase RlmH [Pseudomaricurvus alkylphenolicus]NIB41817.1 23S rRNA (pseudouridine(1915)-N(3))-methyltransferase RlmH [Pseudomaricurvus alkylphenolicus]